MAEFFVTTEMAENKHDQLINSGGVFNLFQDFINVQKYSPGEETDLAQYIEDNLIQFFSVKEVITPNHPAKAKIAGFDVLIPPLHLWPWVMLVLSIGDLMRELIDSPIKLRNVYRPMSYNELVATSELDSDHPNACSGDFDFKSSGDRRKAEQLVRSLANENPQLEISLGMGARTLHIGIMSPKGSRSWFYKSYPDKKIKL
ncbi:MAG: hypothetical protein L3J51_12975 [Cocleimonas sp.]|nr:hypothetical protein [Cocleimonas sp.]